MAEAINLLRNTHHEHLSILTTFRALVRESVRVQFEIERRSQLVRIPPFRAGIFKTLGYAVLPHSTRGFTLSGTARIR